VLIEELGKIAIKKYIKSISSPLKATTQSKVNKYEITAEIYYEFLFT
jgi:hypothetical protein